ncbi:hypothetical protein PR202_ga29925 [Eleusine coracana subsp. coracana]|uniref:Uncharacterized protein n=1 Tax=Eleusine coracana subsp. coracana TaxID=191504 RepID=A0AAV5DL86_ELECO|nr:hypothetical protein PR202_ga29925 [Eleusine coracana subsp. coracana]
MLLHCFFTPRSAAAYWVEMGHTELKNVRPASIPPPGDERHRRRRRRRRRLSRTAAGRRLRRASPCYGLSVCQAPFSPGDSARPCHRSRAVRGLPSSASPGSIKTRIGPFCSRVRFAGCCPCSGACDEPESLELLRRSSWNVPRAHGYTCSCAAGC